MGQTILSAIAQVTCATQPSKNRYPLPTPEISDFEFDQRLRRLQELEAQHPELFDPNSPSQRVGGAPMTGDFATVIHEPPMLSIENAYTLEELHEWDARVKKGLGVDEVEYEAELKIDGVSIDLLYENGALARAPRAAMACAATT